MACLRRFVTEDADRFAFSTLIELHGPWSDTPGCLVAAWWAGWYGEEVWKLQDHSRKEGKSLRALEQMLRYCGLSKRLTLFHMSWFRGCLQGLCGRWWDQPPGCQVAVKSWAVGGRTIQEVHLYDPGIIWNTKRIQLTKHRSQNSKPLSWGEDLTEALRMLGERRRNSVLAFTQLGHA